MSVNSAERPAPDKLLATLADYAMKPEVGSEEAFNTARYCLLDSMGCAVEALQYPACQKLLGPVVAGYDISDGCRVPGTNYILDPVQAAFNIGTMIRWLDFNDTWLAAEWGHPSDNLGGILAVAQHLQRINPDTIITCKELMIAAIKAHEIQGILALSNSFNQVGLDHVLLVRIATTAVTAALLGGSKAQIINAVSNAWLDGAALRTYRHFPNTGSRKSWAAGDATRRGVQHAFWALADEMGYPSALTAKKWGFEAVLFNGQAVTLNKELGSYVMENILFKVSFPAEFHAQTAIEAAIQLHTDIANRVDEISSIVIETQQAGATIIDKTGDLDNPADRDHCMQYMVAIGLLFGKLSASDYEDSRAADPRIDKLRAVMTVKVNKQYATAYFDPKQRAIPNSVQIFFSDGSSTEKVENFFPLGHRVRRTEAYQPLKNKFQNAIQNALTPHATHRLLAYFNDHDAFEKTSIDDFIDLFSAKSESV